ncbi:MAG: Gfo/Idh/MocA family protein [Nitrospinota bacterium]
MSNHKYPVIGVIGCGNWGRNIVRNLSELDAPMVVHDVLPETQRWLRENYPSVGFADSLEDLLKDRRVEAVMVATPPANHAPLACRALWAGKHVFVEKPMAMTVEEGKALCELAESQSRILMVGHLLEYHPAVNCLADISAKGELGEIYYIYSNRLSLGRVRRDVNALWSFAPHDIHLLLRLLGEFPAEVSCAGGNYLQSQIADVTISLFSFPSGIKGHIFVSWLHPFREHNLVLVGERKMAVFEDDSRGGRLTLYPHRVEWVGDVPVAVKADGDEVAYPKREPLREECLHFLRCVVHCERPRTDGENGLDVLTVLEACQASLDQGGVAIRWTGGETGGLQKDIAGKSGR